MDSVRALRDRYVHVLKVLARLSLLSKNSKGRSVAAGLRKRMESFQFIIFIIMWERILRAFNTTSTTLQSPKMELSSAARLLNYTMNELQYLRNNWNFVSLKLQRLWQTHEVLKLSWNALFISDFDLVLSTIPTPI